MMSVTLYSTGCPKCKVLASKLESAGVQFDVESNVDKMQSMGMRSLPMLSVNGDLMDFTTAVKWANERGN